MPVSKERKDELNAAARARDKEIRLGLKDAIERDIAAKGERHLSEVLSYENLYKIYTGQDYKEIEEELDDEGVSEKRKKKEPKKYKNPQPFKSDILKEHRSFPEWLHLRDYARKDLFWLCETVFKKDLVSHVHQPICDMFVKKNFDGAFPAGYQLKDVIQAIDKQERYDEYGNPTKEALILDPRGFYKSTIDGVDCIQWMINVPDVRIFLVAADYKISVSLLKEIKSYLYLPKGGDPTDFHLLFPDYVLRGIDGVSKESFIVPARIHQQRFPTMFTKTIAGGTSGWHSDIKKGDDVVNDENSNTPEIREELKLKFDGTDNVVDPRGFVDNIGTRYWGDPDPDWYGNRIKSATEGPEKDRSPLKYHCRAAWTVKPEYVEVPLRELTEDMVNLTFPEKATFKSLRKLLLQNEKQFRCQQLNEPAGSDQDTGFLAIFEEDILRRHTYQPQAAPKLGDVFVAWDWAPTHNKSSDMSAGVAGRVYKKEDGEYGIVILEIVYGRWKPAELAFNIVALNKKWNPKNTLIEKSQGSDFLQLEIANQARRYGTSFTHIWWKPPALEENAKRNRIRSLQPLLKDDRLWFVAGMWLDDTFSQLIRYTGAKKNGGRKDDLIDAMSYLVYFLPKSISSPPPTPEQVALEEDIKKEAIRKAQYNQMFGAQPSFTPPPVENQSETGGRGSMNSIFGGNGIKAYR